ncbi:hypothetical protein QYE76_005869 [Lolium multiflorum]|uniref:Uncharacterized protein n=1 Tax=Lolium multiflorum TaxID=4521 RepID=A0AAD8RUW8_LOLMU|nr:hypothetical protein QYE76_005869 [Lolium multiflorum]
MVTTARRGHREAGKQAELTFDVLASPSQYHRALRLLPVLTHTPVPPRVAGNCRHGRPPGRVADAYARLGALRVRVKGLGVEKYNDGFEMNEAFIKSKVIAMIVVKQEDTNLALNLQIMTKSADLNSDDLVSYVAANEKMAKAGKRLMAMNRVDEASHNHEASHNLALKARADHGSKEDYEIEEDEEMTSTSDIATDFAFFAKKYKAKFPMLLNDKKKRTCYNCDEDSHFANECPYEKNGRQAKVHQRCTLRGEALVKFDFLMDSLKEKDESIEELEYHLNEKERIFNLLRQELKTERCISQGLKQQIETYELDKFKDLETIDRAQSLTQELNASKEELEVAHAYLTRDLDHLERANKLVKDELKKLGENHDLLQETYKKALGSMKDPIVVEKLACSSTSFTSEHAKLVEEHVRLQEELSLHVETNAYLESLVTKYGLDYHPNESSCEQASILEENVRLTKELAKFTTAKNKMGLDDLLSKQRSNNQNFGLGYVPKSHKKNNYKKEKPAQDKNKKVTNVGKASKGKATSGDRTGPNDHYALFVDYYGDVYANYVGPRNGYAYREYSIWGYSSGGPKWVFDSGCTNHMTRGRGVLDQFTEDINKRSSITFGDNSKGKVHEALVDPDWVIAMQEELECFTRNEVWSLVERPKDRRINVIGTKWVFKNKQDENGIVIRNKARKFEMSMMGELKFFLGFQVRQLAKGTFTSQEKYVKDMLKKFNMTNASPMKTPMPVKGQLGSCDGEKDVDIKASQFIKGVKPRLKPTHPRSYKKNKGRAFVGVEYLSDEEEEDEEKEAGVAGCTLSPGHFTYDYSKDYSTENSCYFMARTTQDDDSDDSPSSPIIGSCLMARETKSSMPQRRNLKLLMFLSRDLDHLERANKLVKDELKKLGENHDLLQESYKRALGSMKDPIDVEKLACSSISFTSEHAKLVEEHVRLQEELSLHVETNAYLESLVTKYGLDYHPNESSCEQASILEENVRLTKELAKFTTVKNKMGLDDLLTGKQLKKKHPIKSIVTTSRPLELLHLDLFGPSHYDTLGGSKYGLVIVDDYSRYSWVFLLKSKDETHREFITFAKKAQHMYESDIKAIRTDNGIEFKNYTMQEFVDDEGIKHEFSAPYTPQQNGVVERKNRTIIEMARTMLSEFNSPHNFWEEAISTAVHYSNRLFLRPLHNKTPYELLTGNKPNVMYIRVFGCKCLVKNNKGKLGKFETRTIEGIFVGYAENSHAYRYYNRSSGTIEVSCDVVFLEDNGSQVEQVVPCVAGNDVDPSSAIKHMGIGHIRPMEVHNDDQDDGVDVSSTPQVEPSSTQAEPSSATQEPPSTQDESQSEEQEEDPHSMEQDHDDDQETSSTHDQAQVVPHDQVLARDEFIDHEGTRPLQGQVT